MLEPSNSKIESDSSTSAGTESSRLALACSTGPERLYFDPQDYFNGLLQDIAAAEREILLEVYSFRYDRIGRQFIEALVAAKQRGVRIRILIDGIGSYPDANLVAGALLSGHCELRIFHPLPWDFSAYRNALTAGRWYSQILHLIAAINQRNHRKLCVIDESAAWIGSFNVSSAHFNNRLSSDGDSWHDTGLRTTAADLIADLLSDFDRVWKRKRAPVRSRTRQFLSNHSIRDRFHRNRRLVGFLLTAKHRIWITNAYFNPSRNLLNGLKFAAKRGVDVRVLVPSRSDVFLFPAISRTYYLDLIGAGIRVYEYQNRLLHSKTILFDDQVLIGSTNLNYRSFFHDLELDALLSSRQSMQCMQQRFLTDLELSTEITLDHWQRYPWLLKGLAMFSRLFRYWM
ncbi:MAG: cardiolipin synthase [Gammaproteobacteria bacterium]|jgi:cardiolipin synthase